MYGLVNRKDKFYFRIRVPQDLKPFFRRDEFLKSLHTDKYNNAKSLVRCLLGQTERVFMLLRSKTLSHDAVRELVTEFVSSTLELKYDDMEYFMEAMPDVMSEIYDEAEATILEGAKIRQPVCTHLPFTSVSPELLCWTNCIEYREDSPEFRRLSHELAASKRLILATIKERMETGDSAYDAKTRDMERTNPKPKSHMLSEAIALFTKSVMKKRDSKKSRAVKPNETLDKIMECFQYETGKPDIPLSDIDYTLTVKVGERIAKYPKYRNTRHKGETLDVIYANEKAEFPNMEGTVKPEISRLSGLYKFCIKALEGLNKNYADELGITVGGKNKGKDSDARDIFRLVDIQEIIRALSDYKNKGIFAHNPHLLFITLIGLYQGARINEICQLQITDIAAIDGIWCIRHSEEQDEDKSIKNRNSIRLNPIHPALIEFGLIRFRDSQAAKGVTGLWEGVRNHSCEYYEVQGNNSHYVSKWWNGTFKNKLNLSNPKKQTFHSTRHTFINWFRQNVRNLDYAAANALSGHLNKDDIGALALQGYNKDAESEKTYTKDLNIKRQLELLEQLDYGIDLSELMVI